MEMMTRRLVPCLTPRLGQALDQTQAVLELSCRRIT